MTAETPRSAHCCAPQSRRSFTLWVLGIISILAVFITTGLRGLDFGHHWDEGIQAGAVMRSVKRGVALPDFYKYPSVTYNISIAAALPVIIAETKPEESDTPGQVRTDFDAVKQHVRSDDYKLRSRTLFVLISALAVLWIALAARAAGASPLTSLFAAALLGFSWEFAYHARWIAPDTVMVQFTSLCIAALIAARSSPRPARWCALAVIAAGLATGTKYPGGLLLFATLPACVYYAKRDGRNAWCAGISAFALFAVTYLVTTPGTLLQPGRFWNDLTYEAAHYSTGHWGFTVDGGAEHLGLATRYLTLDLFSSCSVFAVIAIALAIVGAVRSWSKSKPLFALLVLLPLVYLIYVTSTRVLFVRNLLFVAPFLALLAASAVDWIVTRIPRPATIGLGVLLALGCAANAWTLIDATSEVRDRSTVALGNELAAHLDRYPDRRYHLSKGARNCLAAAQLAVPKHAEFAESDADTIACIPDDVRDHLMWPSNAPGKLLAAIGPRSVNYDWYTTWSEPWIAVITPEYAEWIRKVRWNERHAQAGE